MNFTSHTFYEYGSLEKSNDEAARAFDFGSHFLFSSKWQLIQLNSTTCSLYIRLDSFKNVWWVSCYSDDLLKALFCCLNVGRRQWVIFTGTPMVLTSLLIIRLDWGEDEMHNQTARGSFICKILLIKKIKEEKTIDENKKFKLKYTYCGLLCCCRKSYKLRTHCILWSIADTATFQ